MKSFIAFTSAILIALSSLPAHTQSIPLSSPSTPDQAIETAMPAQSQNASFEEWVDGFEKQFQEMGLASGGRTFFSGQSAVLVPAQNPSFGKQLALAYEKAMFDMRADFILQTYGKLRTRVIREIFEDSSSDKDQFDPVELEKIGGPNGGRIDAIFDKALALIDKSLDNKLIEQGVPAADIQRMSIEQKKTTYKNNVQKEIIKTAFRSMQGLVPVQTRVFTSDTSNGKAVIVGVIAVQSEKTRQFAEDMRRKRPSQVKGEPRTLAEQLPKEKSGYLNEIGLRYTYDEAGRPMLLSYGRSSVAIAPDWRPSRVVQSKQNAAGIARALAESNIVEFMNTNIQVEEKTLTGAQEEELLTQVSNFENGTKANVEQAQEQIAATIDVLLKSGQASASGDLRGSTVVNRWEQQDANGVLHVGTVVAWTYGQLDNANAIDAQARRNTTPQPAAPKGPAKDESRTSRVINKMADF